MKLIDADALIDKISKDVHRLYDQLTDEIIDHFDLEDSKAIYMHSAEQYIKVKFAYQWIKSELEKAKEVDVQLEVSEKIEKQIREEVISELRKQLDLKIDFGGLDNKLLFFDNYDKIAEQMKEEQNE